MGKFSENYEKAAEFLKENRFYNNSGEGDVCTAIALSMTIPNNLSKEEASYFDALMKDFVIKSGIEKVFVSNWSNITRWNDQFDSPEVPIKTLKQLAEMDD